MSKEARKEINDLAQELLETAIEIVGENLKDRPIDLVEVYEFLEKQIAYRAENNEEKDLHLSYSKTLVAMTGEFGGKTSSAIAKIFNLATSKFDQYNLVAHLGEYSISEKQLEANKLIALEFLAKKIKETKATHLYKEQLKDKVNPSLEYLLPPQNKKVVDAEKKVSPDQKTDATEVKKVQQQFENIQVGSD